MSNKSGNDAFWHFCEALHDLADRDGHAVEFVRDEDAAWHAIVRGRIFSGPKGVVAVSVPFSAWTHIASLAAYRNRLFRHVPELFRVERERVYGDRIVAGR